MESACLTQTYEAETQQIVTDVFTSMLKMEVERVEVPQERVASPVLTAAVHFVGSWKGALRIECTPEQTFRIYEKVAWASIRPPKSMKTSAMRSANWQT